MNHFKFIIQTQPALIKRFIINNPVARLSITFVIPLSKLGRILDYKRRHTDIILLRPIVVISFLSTAWERVSEEHKHVNSNIIAASL